MLSTRPSRRRQPVWRPRHQQIRATLTRSDSVPNQHSCGRPPESPFYENELCRNVTYRSASCAHNSNEVTIVGVLYGHSHSTPLPHGRGRRFVKMVNQRIARTRISMLMSCPSRLGCERRCTPCNSGSPCNTVESELLIYPTTRLISIIIGCLHDGDIDICSSKARGGVTLAR